MWRSFRRSVLERIFVLSLSLSLSLSFSKVQLESIISPGAIGMKARKLFKLSNPTRSHIFYYRLIHLSPSPGAHRLSDPRSFIRYSPKIPSADCSPSNFPCRGILSRIASSHNRPSAVLRPAWIQFQPASVTNYPEGSPRPYTELVWRRS